MAFKRYEQLNFATPKNFHTAPDFESHTVDCPCCAFRHPVQACYTDWEEVAQKYQKAYDDMSSTFLRVIAEAEEVWDVPLEGWIQAKKEILLATLTDTMNEHPNPNPNPNPEQ